MTDTTTLPPFVPMPGLPIATPAEPVSARDVEFVRVYTAGAKEYSDEQLCDLLSWWVCPDGSYDLWAAAASILDLRLIGMVTDQIYAPSSAITSGDLKVTYGAAGASTALMRTLATRFWSRACLDNRLIGQQPLHNAWKTLSPVPPGEVRLYSPFPYNPNLSSSQVVNYNRPGDPEPVLRLLQ